jgi:hypothetical protein
MTIGLVLKIAVGLVCFVIGAALAQLVVVPAHLEER